MSELPPPPTTDSSSSTPTDSQSPLRKWSSLAVLTLGLAIVIIDTSLLNVSLSAIIKDLHTDLQSIQWVITAYALMLAAFTITGGRLGDLFGRKKMFMFGAVIFAIGSFIASISHTLPTLLIGESIIEGIGAALMLPATSALVVANFHGKDRATAFGVWGGAAGASSAIGPLLGGYLTSYFSWRWGFRINLFVAALVIIGSLLLLKESKDERKPTLDLWGVILSSLGLLGIVFGIIESSSYGWWKTTKVFSLFHHALALHGFSVVPVSILIGIILLGIFIWWELKTEAAGKTPLVSMKLLQNEQFISGSLTVSILTLAMTGMLFALPVFLQAVKNLDAFHTGLAMVSLSAVLLVVSPLTAWASKKITPKYLIQIGLLIDVIAALVLRTVISPSVPLSHLIPGLSLFGLGMGMVFAPISNLTLSAVPVNQSGEASGVNNTLRQVGSSLGAAIIGAAVLASISANITIGINQSLIIPQTQKSAIVQNLAGANSNVAFGGQSNTPSQAPDQIKTEINSIIQESITKSAKDAYVYVAIFALLAFGAALFLPKTDPHAVPSYDPEPAPAEKHPQLAGRLVGALVIAAIAIGGGIALLKHNSTKTITDQSTNQQTAEQIRNLFTPPQPSNNSPALTTSTPASLTDTQPRPTSPVSPRGASSSNPTTIPAQTYSSTTPQPVTNIEYSNANLKFGMVIPSDWQPQQVSQTEVVFLSSHGQNGSVQAYDANGQSLDVVNQQLAGSPSVRTISQISFHGEPALKFQTTDSQTGIAVIHNNTLYYIMSPKNTNTITNNFSFQ